MCRFSSVILALAFAIACGNADEKVEEKFVKSLESCASKTKVTGAQLEALANMNIPSDKAPMCFLACMAKSMEIMDSNNKFSKSAIKKMMDVAVEKLKENKQEAEGKKMMEVVNKCLDEQTEEKDECLAAKKVMDCVVTNAKKDGQLK